MKDLIARLRARASTKAVAERAMIGTDEGFVLQAAGPYVRVGWNETLEEATARAQRERGLSRDEGEGEKP